MFESVQPAPPDPIFGLVEAMRQDPRSDKINLGAGVYQDETGRTPILDVVKAAEQRLLDSETTKSYLPIDGHPDYCPAVRELILGAGHPAIVDDRAVTAQAPGGTGALRVVADMLRDLDRPPRIWISDPTWANHRKIFRAAGLDQQTYPYYDPDSHGLAWEAMTSTLDAEVAAGDVVLLHGCCHNPTGVDPTPDQWAALADLLERKKALPILDFAYQGFVHGVDDDAANIRRLAERLPEVIVCSSFSKNLGLYAERVGAVTLVAPDAAQAKAVLSQIKRSIRANYSNPPTHGASVAATVLLDAELRQRWRVELAAMRRRIQAMRERFAHGLDERGVRLSPKGNGFVIEQNGMFSYSGLSHEQVHQLREQHGVYMVDSGRLNLAGIHDDNLDRLCDAVAAVTA
ncbi:MAG: amino acid aminotransferase [Acidobacteriota bacterium]